MENKILALASTNPNDAEQTKEMLKEKDKEILSLKEKLSIPPAYPVKTLELTQAETEKEELANKLLEAQREITQQSLKINALEKGIASNGKFAETDCCSHTGAASRICPRHVRRR